MEKIRRAFRDLLGWDSWIYRFCAESFNFTMLLWYESLVTALALQRLARSAPGGDAEALRFVRLIHPFYIRPGTKDVLVALNNFVREEYGAICRLSDPRVLIDAGAYIGDTSAYFLSRFPGLRAIALEPMPENFSQAYRNLAPYGDRVDLRQVALTADGDMVLMSGMQTGACISATGSVEVASQTIPQILNSLPEGRIDILKMDIEGAEKEIFAQSPELWLDRVGMMIVETHGLETTNAFLGVLKENRWSAQRFRNLYFCSKS